MKLNYNLLDPKSTLKIIAVLLKFFVCNFNWMRVLSNTNISCFVSYIFKRSSIPSLTLLFCMVLVFGVGNVWGQSPSNGSFEDGITNWTTIGSAGTTNARTGSNALAHTTSSTSNIDHRNSSTISVLNNNFAHVIGWAIGSNANARASCGGR